MLYQISVGLSQSHEAVAISLLKNRHSVGNK